MGRRKVKKPKKKRGLPPRRKRMKRAARLQSAPSWLRTFSGEGDRSLVRGYSKVFAVDYLAAVKELQMLGLSIDKTYIEQLERTHLTKRRSGRKQRAAKKASGSMEFDIDQDETFAFIAGYTEGGAPFGVTWEEWRALNDRARSCAVRVETNRKSVQTYNREVCASQNL